MALNRDYQSKIRAYYDKLFKKYHNDIKSLGWSRESQLIRFNVALGFIPENAKSLLDIGCGLGHFSQFIKKHRVNLNYMGWEINSNFLKYCTESEGINFENRDICINPPANNSFDITMSIGSLNTECGDNENIARTLLNEMFNASRCICLFSATSIYVDDAYRHRGMYYYDPSEMFNFAKTLTSNVILNHAYLPHDFLLVLYK